MTAPVRLDVSDVFNQSPPYEDVDLYDDDQPLRDAVAANGAGADAATLSAFGKRWGSAEMFEEARLANENVPKLRTFDPKGFRRDVVEFHPAYHRLMAESMAEGIHCSMWRPDGSHTPAEVARAARFYMTNQIEAGHNCPITMTRACVAALVSEPEVRDRLLPKILSRAYDQSFRPWWEKTGITLGMGMTEKQGGTDVRANTTRAVPARDGYDITGHKWFFSAPMCDAFLVLAQAPGGLTCFLVPRFRPDGAVNALQLQRLKDKLGNRSNASSEVEFVEAFGWRVGEEGRGVRTIIEMVQLTRLDCAIASAGFMRMALAQAGHHTRYRRVFQRKLVDQPMMRTVLADLALQVEAAVALVMRLCRAVDRAGVDPLEAARAAAHSRRQISGVQGGPRVHLRGAGVPRRQRIRRGRHAGAALSRGAAQRDLGRLRQCHVSRRVAGAEPGRRGGPECHRGSRAGHRRSAGSARCRKLPGRNVAQRRGGGERAQRGGTARPARSRRGAQ